MFEGAEAVLSTDPPSYCIPPTSTCRPCAKRAPAWHNQAALLWLSASPLQNTTTTWSLGTQRESLLIAQPEARCQWPAAVSGALMKLLLRRR